MTDKNEWGRWTHRALQRQAVRFVVRMGALSALLMAACSDSARMRPIDAGPLPIFDTDAGTAAVSIADGGEGDAALASLGPAAGIWRAELDVSSTSCPPSPRSGEVMTVEASGVRDFHFTIQGDGPDSPEMPVSCAVSEDDMSCSGATSVQNDGCRGNAAYRASLKASGNHGSWSGAAQVTVNTSSAAACAELAGCETTYVSSWTRIGDPAAHRKVAWSRVDGGQLGANNFSAFPAIVFKGQLYMGTGNWTSGCEIWRTTDGQSWQRVVDAGFGGFEPPADRSSNFFMVAMIEHDGYLYASTWDVGWEPGADGADLWRTSDGLHWEAVTTDGFGNAHNHAVSSMVVYQGELYLGMFNPEQGPQVRRLAGNGTVVLVTGGFTPNNCNTDVTSMAVFERHLYAITEAAKPNCVQGTQLWRLKDAGKNAWEQLDDDGLGNPTNNNGVLLARGGRLYASTWNSHEGIEVLRLKPRAQRSLLVADGFGDRNAIISGIGAIPAGSLGDLVLVRLYNLRVGGQLWVSRGGDKQPLSDWAKVTPDGFGDDAQADIGGLAVFDGHLFVGTTGNWLAAGPAPGQIWRADCPVDQTGDGCLGDLFE